ncbi:MULTISPECIES: hypothetical protein [Enterococcus]|uniref:hypothetical protein n=1 Tax=Enterococcus TaxID=1350 RepID=UPI002EC755F9|nr:hypothetical protein [Enterococcus hirae]
MKNIDSFDIFEKMLQDNAFDPSLSHVGKPWEKQIKKRLRQKCLASRNKKEFPKIASQIFGKFRLISEDAAFVSPFIRFRDTKRA